MSINQYFSNKKILQILKEYKSVWSLNYLIQLAYWDLETYMPENGALERGEAIAQTKLFIQKELLQPDFQKLLDQALLEKNLNIHERTVIRLLKREITKLNKLPEAFVERLEKLISESQLAWRYARKQNDFLIFKPFLTQIIDLNREKADYFGYENHPYDALLDEYDEHSTAKKLDKIFQDLINFLDPFLKQIYQAKNYQTENPISNLPYSEEKMQKLNHIILKFFHFDRTSLRLDKSSHPFTSPHGANDIRITTRYHERDFNRSLSATIHEFGHALYDFQCTTEYSFTPLWGGSSLSLHESQSRFWENFIGKSTAFIEKFLPEFNQLLQPANPLKLQDYYHYFNLVQPSLLRVEADELTYHLHIFIRYEVEKAMLAGTCEIDDLNDLWNDLYQKYLGLRPVNFSEGILQDIHWSMGGFGYFPTYTTGTLVSAICKDKLENDLGKIDKLISNNKISEMQTWLADNIHQFGSLYTTDELLKKQFQTELTIENWKKYATKKYSKIYKII
ncbi:MAG: carboxypeptidase M32 [bacterium]